MIDVNDQAAGKTLLLNFGDIGPNAATVGRWIMVTALSGNECNCGPTVKVK